MHPTSRRSVLGRILRSWQNVTKFQNFKKFSFSEPPAVGNQARKQYLELFPKPHNARPHAQTAGGRVGAFENSSRYELSPQICLEFMVSSWKPWFSTIFGVFETFSSFTHSTHDIKRTLTYFLFFGHLELVFVAFVSKKTVAFVFYDNLIWSALNVFWTLASFSGREYEGLVVRYFWGNTIRPFQFELFWTCYEIFEPTER